MSAKYDSTRTMRIDIRPDPVAGEADRDSTPVEGGLSSEALASASRGRGSRSPDFLSLLQSIYDGVLLTDGEGRIVDLNSRAEEFFLCVGNELFGMSVIDLISGADAALLDSVTNNLERHRYTLIEAQCRRRDKTLFPAEIAVSRIGLGEGGQLCFSVRDITVRKRTQEALEDAVTRLEKHDRARLQFVSNVSHELRTPLTSMIYAVANMLRGVTGPLPDKAKHYLEILSGDSRRLLNTVNDILDLRKIESNSLTLEKRRVPFSRLVQVSAHSLNVQAQQKGIDLRISERTREWFVNCDAGKMERVVLNVVGNAVKFTPPTGRIDVHVEDDPERADHVLLTVVDTGIGIPQDAIDKVTIRYFTVGEQPSGAGLGLAISKEIVELHGGHIDICSPPVGQASGTGIHVSLPVCAPPTVLVADDEETVVNLLEQQLSREGYTVLCASDGDEAFKRAKEDRPDLVILDVKMPGMDGTELVLKMKGERSLLRTPIVVISGIKIGEGKEEVLRNFSVPVFPKPWGEAELLNRVGDLFLAGDSAGMRPVVRVGETSTGSGKG